MDQRETLQGTALCGRKGRLQNDRSNTGSFIFLIENQCDIVSMDTLTPYFTKAKIPWIVKYTTTYH